MISRYSTPEMNRIWSESNKLSLWLKVEMASLMAYEEMQLIPKGTAQIVREKAEHIDFEVLRNRTLEIEVETRHDVIAFLSALEEFVGEDSRFIHFGLTSSDVVDTAFALQLREALTQIHVRMSEFRGVLFAKALEHKNTMCLGRTHGQAAQVTTFGLKILGFVSEIDRDLERVTRAIETASVGKMSGAVGNYANSSPKMETIALQELQLSSEKVATQIVCRDRHAEVFAMLGIIAGTLERLAVEIRLLAHAQVAEAFEPFGKSQRGSSAMPHKRNPILSENVTGLCRLIRGYSVMALENQALWHERDISHSSVERVIGPDAFHALDFALLRMMHVVKNLDVDIKQMQRHIEDTNGSVYSEAVLLALVSKGVLRQEAYRWVQDAAKQQKLLQVSFVDALNANSSIREHLKEEEILSVCDLNAPLKHVDTIFERFVS